MLATRLATTPRLLLAATLLGAAALAYAGPTNVTYDAQGNVAQVCAPRGCLEGGQLACGTLDNNCFGTITCSCPAGAQWSCGATNLCACTPQSCAAQGKNCGTISDLCGGSVPCGTCPPGQACNGSNVCVCQPTTCAAQGKTCGTISNSCEGTLNCGTCAAGQVCLATNTCCRPTTCAAQGYSCGSVPNGCGGTLTCGTCTVGHYCQADSCLAGCAPRTCRPPLVWDPDACRCTQ